MLEINKFHPIKATFQQKLKLVIDIIKTPMILVEPNREMIDADRIIFSCCWILYSDHASANSLHFFSINILAMLIFIRFQFRKVY